jgi:DNA gyrase subunit B
MEASLGDGARVVCVAGPGWESRRESMRKRPGMYLGSADDVGLHWLVQELVINAVDVLQRNGDRSEVWVTLRGDEITVADNGAGFPVEVLEVHGGGRMPFVEAALTQGGLSGKNNGPELVNTSPHGIGLEVVHALSKRLVVEIAREGRQFVVGSRDGWITEPLKEVGRTAATGTSITFVPELSLFRGEHLQMEAERIAAICNRYAFLYPNIRFMVIDQLRGRRISVHRAGGLKDWVEELCGEAWRRGPTYCVPRTEIGVVEAGRVWMTASVAFVEREKPEVRSVMNGIESPGGGSHEEGLLAGVDTGLWLAGLGREERAAWRRGMVGVIHVWHPREQWEGCTKSRVEVEGLREMVAGYLRGEVARWVCAQAAGIETRPRVVAEEAARSVVH